MRWYKSTTFTDKKLVASLPCRFFSRHESLVPQVWMLGPKIRRPYCFAFWIMQTLDVATMMLECGADDIDGTVVWYDITKVGGATTHQETTAWDLCKSIREAGFRPLERDSLYRPVARSA